MSRISRRRRIGAILALAGALLMLAVGPGCIDVTRLLATPTPGPEAGITIIVPVTATPPVACTPEPPVFVTAVPPPPTVVVTACPPVIIATATPPPCAPCRPVDP